MPRKRYRRQEGWLKSLFNGPSQAERHSMLFAAGVNHPEDLKPRELEELAATVFARQGYRNVKHTGGVSSDGGVDVWMLNEAGNVEIVQCKQLKNRVDRSELIYFAKVMRRQHATRGHYWAPGGFTQPAIDYANENSIKVYEAREIREWVERVYGAEARAEQQRASASRTVAKAPPLSQTPILRSLPLQAFVVMSMLILLCVCTGLPALISALPTSIPPYQLTNTRIVATNNAISTNLPLTNNPINTANAKALSTLTAASAISTTAFAATNADLDKQIATLNAQGTQLMQTLQPAGTNTPTRNPLIITAYIPLSSQTKIITPTASSTRKP